MSTDEYVPNEAAMREAYVWLSAGDNEGAREQAAEDFNRGLARVRREAVEEYKNRQVQIHLNPAPAQMVPVPVRCPRCGHR